MLSALSARKHPKLVPCLRFMGCRQVSSSLHWAEVWSVFLHHFGEDSCITAFPEHRIPGYTWSIFYPSCKNETEVVFCQQGCLADLVGEVSNCQPEIPVTPFWGTVAVVLRLGFFLRFLVDVFCDEGVFSKLTLAKYLGHPSWLFSGRMKPLASLALRCQLPQSKQWIQMSCWGNWWILWVVSCHTATHCYHRLMKKQARGDEALDVFQWSMSRESQGTTVSVTVVKPTARDQTVGSAGCRKTDMLLGFVWLRCYNICWHLYFHICFFIS